MTRSTRMMLRLAKVLPIFVLYQTVGCLPNNSFAQVFGENVILTAAVAIQTISSIIFNTLFGVL